MPLHMCSCFKITDIYSPNGIFLTMYAMKFNHSQKIYKLMPPFLGDSKAILYITLILYNIYIYPPTVTFTKLTSFWVLHHHRDQLQNYMLLKYYKNINTEFKILIYYQSCTSFLILVTVFASLSYPEKKIYVHM